MEANRHQNGSAYPVGFRRVWSAYHATNEGNADLPESQESARAVASLLDTPGRRIFRSLGTEIDGARQIAEQTEV